MHLYKPEQRINLKPTHRAYHKMVTKKKSGMHLCYLFIFIFFLFFLHINFFSLLSFLLPYFLDPFSYNKPPHQQCRCMGNPRVPGTRARCTKLKLKSDNIRFSVKRRHLVKLASPVPGKSCAPFARGDWNAALIRGKSRPGRYQDPSVYVATW